MNPKYKKHLILASLATLLPLPVGLLILLRSPSELWFHLKQLSIMPIGMLVTLYVAMWFTLRDPGNKGRNQKPLTVVLWIIPVICNLCCGITLALFMGYEFSPAAFMLVPMGLMFAAIGNYLPKVKMNGTLGIKIYWTYTSEENWNATHRFAGKTWFLGGLVMALGGLLPPGLATTLTTVLFTVLIVLPLGYSWRYYKMQKARGDTLQVPADYPRTGRAFGKWSWVILAAILVFCGVMMFTGNIDYQFREDELLIEADFYSDASISYDSIQSVEMRIGNMEGTRVGGFGSFRLLMGYFSNEEFGSYVRFTYYDPGSTIVLRQKGGQICVLSGRDLEQTNQIYQQLRSKIG